MGKKKKNCMIPFDIKREARENQYCVCLFACSCDCASASR